MARKSRSNVMRDPGTMDADRCSIKKCHTANGKVGEVRKVNRMIIRCVDQDA